MWRFIPNFAEILRVINNMLKKKSEVKWTLVAKKYFEGIKEEITKDFVLISANFSKYFLVFSFYSEHTISRVLL